MKTISERFFEKVCVKGDNECWEWTSAKNNGYGSLSTKNGKSPMKAHRVSYEIHFGKIPDGLCVCHKCDNPSCVNPKHLFLGTQKDNMEDAYRKGRIDNFIRATGSGNNSATLTDEQVNCIREEYSNGATLEYLKNKYKHSNIVKIVRNIAYHNKDYAPINGNAKKRPHRRVFTKEQAKEIQTSKQSNTSLGEKYNVSKTTIANVKKGSYK